MSSSQNLNQRRKSYDDIPYEKRTKLIELINQGKWTIRAAAARTGIKLCTAKYILYHYRREGKIYSKKRTGQLSNQSGDETFVEKETQKIVYVPYPVYIFCVPNVQQQEGIYTFLPEY